MKKKTVVSLVLAVICLLVVVGIIGGVKALQIRELIGANGQMGPPSEVVATAVVENENWERILQSTGSVRAIAGVRISAEAPGMIEEILFTEGAMVEKGTVLLRMDQAVESAEVQSAEAALELAKINDHRSSDLLEQRVISQSEYDSVKASLNQAEAASALAKARLNRKEIRAPFDGRLGIRRVDPGEYLQLGEPVVSLQSSGSVYVDFSLPQRFLTQVQPGMPVRVTVRSDNGAVVKEGQLITVEPDIELFTRTLTLRAEVPDEKSLLLPGMYVQVELVLSDSDEVLAIPGTSIRYAPYGNSVFVVVKKDDQLIAEQRFVRMGRTRGDFVQILDGLEAGDTVVSDGAFKLRNQSPIEINNDAAPQPERDPRPDEA